MVKLKLKKVCQCPNRCYKLIFMDIQMPVMDGHEATIAILKEFKKSLNNGNSFNPINKTKDEDINKFHSSLLINQPNPVKK